MFIYTRALGYKILDDLKKFIFSFGIASQLLYIAFLIYALASGSGIFAVNLILLVLCVGYLTFYAITGRSGDKKNKKSSSRAAAHAFAISKILIRAFTLGVTLYGIHIATTNVSTVNVILAALTVIGWTLGVLFELVRIVFERYFDLVSTAVKTDVQPYLNLYNKIARREGEPERERTRTDEYLDTLATKLKNEITEKKAIESAQRQERKLEAKRQKVEKVKSLLGFMSGKKKTDKAPDEEKEDELIKK